MGTARVLICDDHSIARTGLRAMLAGCDGVEVAGEAGDGREAVAQAERLRPDVILMDILMPEMDGVEATRAILERQPEARIVILTSAALGDKVLAAVQAGALGFVAKSSPEEELLTAIDNALRGEPSLPADLTRRLLQDSPPAPATEKLTEREIDILRLVAKGLKNQDIGDHVGISEATVRTHITRIFNKLGAENRVVATLYALAYGVTTVEESLHG